MNARAAFTIITLLAAPWLGAQNVVQEPQEDPVQKAIREFNNHEAGKPNEVTVVLDPVRESTTPVVNGEKPVQASDKPAAEPVLVTGNPPAGLEPANEVENSPPAPPEATTHEEPAPQPQKGLAVRVEKLQAGSGSIDPSQVKLLAPFPAKPLAQAPAGWHLEASESAPPFTREVELSPGKKITLKVRPHLLVPDADGATGFNVSEPGFDASLGYQQNATVGAILSHSIRQLDEDSKQLGGAIDQLQQLLVSLPKPEIKPETPVPPSIPAPNRKR